MIVAALSDPANDFIARYPWVLPVVFPVFFVALWYVILNLAGKLSGWSSLAEHYRAVGPFQGEKWWFQSAGMRYLSHYNGCLTFGANEIGMYAAGWGPFRIGAPPLLVPWGELTISVKNRFLLPGYEIRFRQTPDVYMWVRGKLGERLLNVSSRQASGIRMAPPIG